ncbi:hypothetical protein [Klebsiella aerogenes]|uniref:hypothetical protein n=1 Tax=Klebsiella aerogenes TaxID=548 RepID=UPI0021D2E436|nr:hypothetical protein [Klebsiella aerogenes]MCU6320558.1 hypothetical protein [Klebsiella aerogenes]
MSQTLPQKSLREILATDGDLRRKMQSAAVIAAYKVIEDAGYKITQQDIDEMKADQTAVAFAISELSPSGAKDDNTPAVIIAAGIGTAIAAGGF